MDDFLLLTSFASRWDTVCLGWNISQWPYLTKQYRHGRLLPHHLQNLRHPVKQDIETGLVDLAVLPDFLSRVWPLWNGLDEPSRGMMRQVLGSIIHAQSLDLHAAFIALYAALEMMVLHFRRAHDLELVLSNPEQWKQLEGDLKTFISKHPLLTGASPEQKAKRQKAHEKVSEFNRVAFGTAFNAFCTQTDPPILCADLWPVNGKNSLSWIRNRLVHGELEGREQSSALFHARCHLGWLVERCVLCLLSWLVEDSRAASDYLTHLNAYRKENWEAARTTLFSG